MNISNFSGVSHVHVVQLINLLSLRVHGLEPYHLHTENVPKLVHVSIVKARLTTCRYCREVAVFAQPRRLRLYVDLLDMSSYVRKHVSPKFAQLKHMELDIAIDGECINHHQLFSWVETCPSMKELQIKFLWPSEVSYQYRKLDRDVIERKAEIDRLRTLRLSGYRGTVSELEFVLYVVKNATNLKDLIVVEDRHRNHASASPKKFSTRAFKHLKSLIPSYVDFISV